MGAPDISSLGFHPNFISGCKEAPVPIKGSGEQSLLAYLEEGFCEIYLNNLFPFNYIII